MGKRILIWGAVLLLLLITPFVVLQWLDAPIARKITPIVGTWRSTMDRRTMLDIHVDEDAYLITIHHTAKGLHHKRTYRLHYKACIHYFDDAGRRIDLFYTPVADALLLTPGGTYRRTSNTQDYD